MLSSLTTKLALKKLGLPSNTLDFNFAGNDTNDSKPRSVSRSNTGRNGGLSNDAYDDGEGNGGWPAWMTMPAISMTVQPWFSPPPPPVPVAAECPRVGDLAPLDRDRKLTVGGGRPVLIVFLRCVGCAFAQKTFLALRAISIRTQLRCIAISHSSPAATQKWLDLLGGAWNVEVIVDQERAIYAAWGLGLCSVWQMFNPSSQVQGWKEKGWLGEKVAGAISQTSQSNGPPSVPGRGERSRGTVAGKLGRANTGFGGGKGGAGASIAPTPEEEEAALASATTTMGNKWQTAGAFAVDGRGTVVWGAKAARVDDLLDLDTGVQLLRR